MTDGGPRPGEQTDAPVSSWSGVRRSVGFLSELDPRMPRAFLALVFVSVAAGVAEAGALVAFVRALTSVTSEVVAPFRILGVELGTAPGPLLLVAGVLATASTVLHLVAVRVTVVVSQRSTLVARERLIAGFMHATWEWVSMNRSGRFQEVVGGLAGRNARLIAALASFLSGGVMLLVLSCAAVVASPGVALGLLGFALVALVGVRPLLGRISQSSRHVAMRSLGLAESLSEAVAHAREAAVFGVRRAEADALVGTAKDVSDIATDLQTTRLRHGYLFKDLALVGLIAVVGVLYLLVDLRVGAVTAAVLLVIRALLYAQRSVIAVQDLAEHAAAVEVLASTLDELERHREVDGARVATAAAPIRFDRVTYRYDGRGDALDDVSFEIPRGATVGLAGPSGAGKSTVAELCLGLRRPSSGRVTVAGVDLIDVRRTDWARLTALVPQDPALMAGDIIENVRFLRDWIDDDMAVDALRRAHLLDELAGFADGVRTVLGPGGIGVSGGQRQRLAFARALAGQPELLVLDEPTSALDGRSEALFRQTIDELHGSLTILLIAHRPTTLDVCDQVLQLRGGRLVGA